MPKVVNNPDNKVIIIGGDHHNGLNLARIFGLNGKKVFAVVITDQAKSWMVKSKFIDGYSIFKTEKEGLDFVLEKFSSEPAKPFIIPYSDGAALELDLRLNEFKEKFFVPSINGKQGEIARLMDKEAQYNWAQGHGIKMAKSETISLDADCVGHLDNFQFPIILKPAISAKGDKQDISICESIDETKKSFAVLKEKGYGSIFAQEYLNIDYEVDIVGAIVPNKEYIFTAYHIIRSWPAKRGTSSFVVTITDEEILHNCKNLLKELANFGFCGNFDIEAFMVNGLFYLIEVNWRNSGSDFRCLKEKFYYAYWHYQSICSTNRKMPCWSIPFNHYSMTEDTDFRHILTKNISLKQWINDVRRTDNFATFRLDDLKPFIWKNVLSRITPKYIIKVLKKFV